MADPKPSPEPSMEDILASIRRIISDEDGNDQPETLDFDGEQVEVEASDASPVEADDDGPNNQDDIDALFGGGGDDDASDDFDAFAADAELDEPDDGDVLELTEDMLIDEDVSFDDPDAVVPPPPIEPIDDDLSFADAATPEEPTEEDLEAAADMFVAETPDADTPASPDAARLMSTDTDAAVRQAFGQLATTLLSRDTRTVEDLITEMLRPMLRDWIDDNLSQIVERLVREEIERVARGR